MNIKAQEAFMSYEEGIIDEAELESRLRYVGYDLSMIDLLHGKFQVVNLHTQIEELYTCN